MSLNLQCPELGALISQRGLACLWEFRGPFAQGIFSPPCCTGQDHVDFGQPEPHTVLFHEPGSFSVWVGGRGKVYRFNFPEGKNASVRTVSLGPPLSPLPSTSLSSGPNDGPYGEGRKEGAGISSCTWPSTSITSHPGPGEASTGSPHWSREPGYEERDWELTHMARQG